MDNLESFLKEFEPEIVAGALKGIIRRKLTTLHKSPRTHANSKLLDQEIAHYKELENRIIGVYPDTRIYKD